MAKETAMHLSLAAAMDSRRTAMAPVTMQTQPPTDSPPAADSASEAEIKRAIRELLDVLPKDVLDELNSGAIDLKDTAFLDGLTDHVSRLSLASPKTGQKILGKIIKLKKLITRGLRESDPDVTVSNTVTRTGQRVSRNDPCLCGSGKKYKQCCMRKK
jgi:SEC-C motif-containing protein